MGRLGAFLRIMRIVRIGCFRRRTHPGDFAPVHRQALIISGLTRTMDDIGRPGPSHGVVRSLRDTHALPMPPGLRAAWRRGGKVPEVCTYTINYGPDTFGRFTFLFQALALGWLRVCCGLGKKRSQYRRSVSHNPMMASGSPLAQWPRCGCSIRSKCMQSLQWIEQGRGIGLSAARFQHQGQPNTSPENHNQIGPQCLQVACSV